MVRRKTPAAECVELLPIATARSRRATSRTKLMATALQCAFYPAGRHGVNNGKKKSNSFKNTLSLLMTRSALVLGQQRGFRTPAQNALRRRDSLPAAAAEAAGSQQGAPAPRSSSEEARLTAGAARGGGPRARRQIPAAHGRAAEAAAARGCIQERAASPALVLGLLVTRSWTWTLSVEALAGCVP